MARSAAAIAKTNRTRAETASAKAAAARQAGQTAKAGEYEAAAAYFDRMAAQAEAPGFRKSAYPDLAGGVAVSTC